MDPRKSLLQASRPILCLLVFYKTKVTNRTNFCPYTVYSLFYSFIAPGSNINYFPTIRIDFLIVLKLQIFKSSWFFRESLEAERIEPRTYCSPAGHVNLTVNRQTLVFVQNWRFSGEKLFQHLKGLRGSTQLYKSLPLFYSFFLSVSLLLVSFLFVAVLNENLKRGKTLPNTFLFGCTPSFIERPK